MYFDEDGDLAHEFYEEVVVDRAGKHVIMRKKKQDSLKPQVTLNILLKVRLSGIIYLYVKFAFVQS